LGAGGRGFESRRPDVSIEPTLGYAQSGGINIAYASIGEGNLDVVVVPGFISHLMMLGEPPAAHIGERLSGFARVITYDKPGTGLSDPVSAPPTLEDRMDGIRAVMDAVGSERAALFGISEGSATAMLFAAAHPERVVALALYGSAARTTEAPDYPWAPPAEAMLEASREFLSPYWGEGTSVEIFAPSLRDDPVAKSWWSRLERMGASPAMRDQLYAMYLDIDVRHILPTIHVPTLVIHRRSDPLVNVRGARWLADQIPNAKYVELRGMDHSLISNPDEILDEVQEFFTGVRPIAEPDRVLATVMFTDIVGSTTKAAELGDAKWREVLERQQRVVRGELDRFRGREVKSTGDGFLATFDGPARAVHCGQAIVEAVRPLGIDVRVGLHSGEVEVMGQDVGGIAVHIAARVGSLAGSGEVLVSETVRGIVAGSGITFDDRGEQGLKGIPDTWRLYAARA
jgi:pimeloyl-ACP methyl ester carboxylesterase